MTQQVYVDDKAIPDEDSLWRRVKSINFDEALNRKRPSTAEFEDSVDGSPMSCVWTEFHLASGLTMDDFLTGHERFGVVSFPVALARQLGFSIQKDPLPECPAHVLVAGNKTKSARKRLSRECKVLIETSFG